MYVLELTDEYILIYNKPKKLLIKESIPYNIIKDNKIYDYLKLNRIIEAIFTKHNLLNSLFKIKVNILTFEKLTPAETYLVKNIFRNISNTNLEIIHPWTMFNENHLLVSGNKIYYKNQVIKNLNKKEYILIGYNENYEKIINELEKNYDIKVFHYENSQKIIFETIFY